MGLLKTSIFGLIFLTPLLATPATNDQEGISQRTLPLILQQSQEFQKVHEQIHPTSFDLTSEQENDFYLPIDQCDKRRILYLMSKGQIEKALSQYLALYEKERKHDSKLLHEIASSLLESGTTSYDLEVQMLTLCGIALSGQKSSLEFLRRALNSNFPIVQSVALALLGSIHDDQCDEIIADAMHSNYLMVRYEALYHLVARRSKNALGYVDSLVNLLHPAAKPLFVEFYALHGSAESEQKLKSFLHDSDLNVRIAAISSIHNHHFDHLLANIRAQFSTPDPTVKEACSAALGAMKDLHSIASLKNAAESPFEETQLAALFALHQLGDQKAKEKIAELAKKKNLFAIALLGKIEGFEDLLAKLSTNIDSTVRLNASIALLYRRDPRCLYVIKDILTSDIDFIGFVPFVSKGRTLVAWKPISPSVIKHPDIKRNIQAITLSFINEILNASIELHEDCFLEIANELLSRKTTHSSSQLMHLLENLKSERIISLLKQKSQELGSPLIRGYASLALYRMEEKSAFKDAFITWLKSQKGEELIQFHPLMDRGAREDSATSNYSLAPEDKSALLIESFETLANKHEIEGITLLLEMMLNGHPKNRYALAGLLLKSIH